ncbi:MAG TPA: type II toxin-antitoxin system VapC family toxin [Kofleriaceae bacterium]|nr:type II toxin-antitoxin system VapC family toxin [Kofleriaceae bacterium]
MRLSVRGGGLQAKTISGERVVVDTSILIAVVFEEAHAEWAVGQLSEHAPRLRMSTVNLAETLILIRDRQPQLYDELEAQILELGIRFVAPDVAQARLAAEARVRFPLNLGDCFAYALACEEDCPILTLDQDFRAVDREVILP